MDRTVRPTKIRRTLDNVTAFPPSNNKFARQEVCERPKHGRQGRCVKRDCSYTAGQSSDSGTESKNLVTAQYSASMRVPAGTQRYAGTSNRRPRSIIRRRDSGIGETPNSIPRVSVVPFQGGSVRLWFSSQIPIHGKSPGFQT